VPIVSAHSRSLFVFDAFTSVSLAQGYDTIRYEMLYLRALESLHESA